MQDTSDRAFEAENRGGGALGEATDEQRTVAATHSVKQQMMTAFAVGQRGRWS